ncbi:hypothetical protein QBC45DRAFT_91115 [Copromyces sp. CBS 386.78]|nr:hypothetical protein QBC45DRAFT_91115 [Copromyces sp. CBS 386.78]
MFTYVTGADVTFAVCATVTAMPLAAPCIQISGRIINMFPCDMPDTEPYTDINKIFVMLRWICSKKQIPFAIQDSGYISARCSLLSGLPVPRPVFLYPDSILTFLLLVGSAYRQACALVEMSLAYPS